MIAVFSPSRLAGQIVAPPSKSMTHRLLICAALTKDVSVIRRVELSQDVCATVKCLRALGVKTEIQDDVATVYGVGLEGLCPQGELPCGESGSTLRFLLPICLMTGKTTVFTGSERLFERPLDEYEAFCKDKGFLYKKENNCLTVCGRPFEGEVAVKGNVSSQFATGFLLAVAACQRGGTVRVLPPVESRSYIDVTAETLSNFGVTVKETEKNVFSVLPGQDFMPGEFTVEADLSNAAFFEAFNLLGGRVDVCGLPENSKQADGVYVDYFAQLKNGAPTLSVEDCPDLAPVLMTLAALCNGATLTKTKRLCYKESDRGVVTAKELAKCGADIVVKENEIEIRKSVLHAPTEPLCGHNDHRVVMALSVLMTVLGGELHGTQAVAKSMPVFFERIQKLGARVVLKEDGNERCF